MMADFIYDTILYFSVMSGKGMNGDIMSGGRNRRGGSKSRLLSPPPSRRFSPLPFTCCLLLFDFYISTLAAEGGGSKRRPFYEIEEILLKCRDEINETFAGPSNTDLIERVSSILHCSV